MVEGSGLENRRYESIRGFESHSLRQKNAPLVGAFSFSAWIFAEWDLNRNSRPCREAGEGLRENMVSPSNRTNDAKYNLKC